MPKVFATGDIHGDMQINRLGSSGFPQGKDLTKEDIVIILGDFGLLWEYTVSGTEKYWLDWLEAKPWTTVFIDGNHENFVRLYELPTEERFGADVGIIRPSIYHLRRGRIYTIGGQTFFAFGGALSIDKDRRIQGISWWSEEIPSRKEFHDAADLLDKQEYVDFILTHAAPLSILIKLGIYINHIKYRDPTTQMLDCFEKTTRYGLWLCGHYHVDQKIERVHLLYEDIVQIME